ncbi:hypothetical protein KPL74_17865 [Bacillus sp. NP157]|nr:hypothetical protein KPL74_17865 [Bacillus sp. NP157]
MREKPALPGVPWLAATLLSVFSCAALAQAVPTLPPLPPSSLQDDGKRMELCTAIDCAVGAAQVRALANASALYRRDPLAAKDFSAVLGMAGDGVAVTLSPAPIGARGRAITYIFDAQGQALKQSFVNR